MSDVVAVVTDLYFISRISAAAGKAGRTVEFVRLPEQLTEMAPPSIVLVDLDAAADVEPLIRAVRERWEAPIIAFGPHLDTAGRKGARAAGADRVLAKSKFVAELPRMMDREQTGEASEPLETRPHPRPSGDHPVPAEHQG